MHVSRNLACHIRHETCDNQLQNYFCSHKFFIRMELPVFMNDLHVHEEYAAKNPDVFVLERSLSGTFMFLLDLYPVLNY